MHPHPNNLVLKANKEIIFKIFLSKINVPLNRIVPLSIHFFRYIVSEPAVLSGNDGIFHYCFCALVFLGESNFGIRQIFFVLKTFKKTFMLDGWRFFT
jgi:hypothetical protein